MELGKLGVIFLQFIEGPRQLLPAPVGLQPPGPGRNGLVGGSSDDRVGELVNPEEDFLKIMHNLTYRLVGSSRERLAPPTTREETLCVKVRKRYSAWQGSATRSPAEAWAGLPQAEQGA